MPSAYTLIKQAQKYSDISTWHDMPSSQLGIYDISSCHGDAAVLLPACLACAPRQQYHRNGHVNGRRLRQPHALWANMPNVDFYDMMLDDWNMPHGRPSPIMETGDISACYDDWSLRWQLIASIGELYFVISLMWRDWYDIGRSIADLRNISRRSASYFNDEARPRL